MRAASTSRPTTSTASFNVARASGMRVEGLNSGPAKPGFNVARASENNPPVDPKSLLRRSPLYVCLKDRLNSDQSGSGVLSLVEDAVGNACQRAKLVLRHMKQFTLHDADHLFNVLDHIRRLVPRSNLGKLSVPELILLILSAFFHDIGMAPAEDEVILWRRALRQELRSPAELLAASSFITHLRTCQHDLDHIAALRRRNETVQADQNEEQLISNYIRLTHASRCRVIIDSDMSKTLAYGNVQLAPYLADLCESHNNSPLSLLEMDTSLLCASGVYVSLPFCGVILRLADLLDFDPKRTPDVLYRHIGLSNPVSLLEWEKHRSVTAWELTADRCIYSTQCDHPAVEAAIRHFCDMIDRELLVCRAVLDRLTDHVRQPYPTYYRIPLPLQVDRSRIGPRRDTLGRRPYRFHDTKFHLSEREIIHLLMGTEVYRAPSTGVRELLMNAVDACVARAHLEAAWN